MTSLLTRLTLASLLAFAVACGGTEIGEPCDDVGSTDECVSDAVCTNESDRNVCRAVCVDEMDCPDIENCNGVSGSSIKSCQP